MATKLFALVIVLGVLAGCNNAICARKSDCAQGMTCSAVGLCVAAPDGGVSETGDAGTTVDGGP